MKSDQRSAEQIVDYYHEMLTDLCLQLNDVATRIRTPGCTREDVDNAMRRLARDFRRLAFLVEPFENENDKATRILLACRNVTYQLEGPLRAQLDDVMPSVLN